MSQSAQVWLWWVCFCGCILWLRPVVASSAGPVLVSCGCVRWLPLVLVQWLHPAASLLLLWVLWRFPHKSKSFLCTKAALDKWCRDSGSSISGLFGHRVKSFNLCKQRRSLDSLSRTIDVVWRAAPQPHFLSACEYLRPELDTMQTVFFGITAG